MGKYKVIVLESAQKDLNKIYKSGDKSSVKRIENIIAELYDNPRIGLGKPEQLKFDLSGYWSRRINKKDRLIYRIEENIITVTIVSAFGHYSDK